MRAGLLLAVLLVTGCATEVTALVGPRVQNRHQGEAEIALTIMVVRSCGGRCVYGWVHDSEPAHGAPFNSHDESTFDQAGIGLRFGQIGAKP